MILASQGTCTARTATVDPGFALVLRVIGASGILAFSGDANARFAIRREQTDLHRFAFCGIASLGTSSTAISVRFRLVANAVGTGGGQAFHRAHIARPLAINGFRASFGCSARQTIRTSAIRVRFFAVRREIRARQKDTSTATTRLRRAIGIVRAIDARDIHAHTHHVAPRRRAGHQGA